MVGPGGGGLGLGALAGRLLTQQICGSTREDNTKEPCTVLTGMGKEVFFGHFLGIKKH
jgi:glycine/D-amino acid oxidase-like deaminating enzyme